MAELYIELLSETTPGRGEGTAGEVDTEVTHDANGLPFIHGKTLHGLLLESWLLMASHFPELHEASLQVFGQPGDNEDTAILRIGDALLPDEVRDWVNFALKRTHEPLTPDNILRSLTNIRRQTSQSRERGAAEDTTLRTSRVLLRQLVFIAPLTWMQAPEPAHLRCLALSALGARQLGAGCTRGRGYVRLTLDNDKTHTLQLVLGEVNGL